jgi:hypothetical protein
LAFKTFEKWDAHLSATVTNRSGETRLILRLDTPHVSRRDEVVQITMPGSPTSLNIRDECR